MNCSEKTICQILVESCASSSANGARCRMSDTVCGWGCRFLIVVPDRIPRNERERGLLFSKVYSLAKNSGVLSCPFYKESTIDEIVDNRDELSKIITNFSSTFQF